MLHLILSAFVRAGVAVWHWLLVVDGWSLFGVVNDWPRWAWLLFVSVFSGPLVFVLRVAYVAVCLSVPVVRFCFALPASLLGWWWPRVGVAWPDLLLFLPFAGSFALVAWVLPDYAALHRWGDWRLLLPWLAVACLSGFFGLVWVLNRLRFWLDRNKVLLGLKATRQRSWLFPQVRLRSDRHLLSIAPTGSGKGRGLILPNLLDLPGVSVFVVDPKGENALVSASWRRQRGHEVVIFNPYGLFADAFAARGFEEFQSFNPLENLNPQDVRFVGDVDNLAEALVYSAGDKDDSHWTEAARGLVGFLIMYLVAEPTETATLRRLRSIIQGGHSALVAVLGRATESPLASVREGVGRYAVATAEVLSVIATAEAQTRMFKDEAICAALEGGRFDFGKMKRGLVSVYLVLPGDYLKERARYLRLILNTAMGQFMRSGKGKRQVLVILDEFANLGGLAMIKQGFGLIRGYGVTLWPFVQDLTQLQRLYPDDWGTFEANTGAVTVAAVNDNTTAEYFIKRAGKTWTKQTTKTKNTQKKAFALFHDGESAGVTSRDELTNTLNHADLFEGGDSVFVFLAGKMEPLKLSKPFYDRYIYRRRADKNPML